MVGADGRRGDFAEIGEFGFQAFDVETNGAAAGENQRDDPRRRVVLGEFDGEQIEPRLLVRLIDTKHAAEYRRCRTALRFERVSACKCRNLDQTDKAALLNLLAVEFSENDAPAGVVSLIFSGGGVIRLDVECLEAELADLGEVSVAALCPDHFTAGLTAA